MSIKDIKVKPRRTIDNQLLMYDEIRWETKTKSSGPLDTTGDIAISGPSAGLNGLLSEGMKTPPYWEFKYSLNHTSGITLKDVIVKDSQSKGSTENVFKNIFFENITVTFEDNTTSDFNMLAAFSHPESYFEIGQQGRRITLLPNDTLFQRGMKLTLVDTFNGDCKVTVELAVVFRGAHNDIDPGGMPVAMILYPQISLTWHDTWTEGGQDRVAKKRVKKFTGNVKMIVNNTMYPGHLPMKMKPENLAGFFTDSNTSLSDWLRANNFGGIFAIAGSTVGAPFGWAMVFDYNKSLFTEIFGKVISHLSESIVGVYGQGDPQFSTKRDRIYNYPTDHGPGIHVKKWERQGMYDNIHIHARMHDPDSKGHVQVHAPFCGHSCTHMHWRWSSISVNGADDGRGWSYKGWGYPESEEICPVLQAYSTINSPMIPPTHRLVLDVVGAVLEKELHYKVEIDPLGEASTISPSTRQVILEHGLGWAFRYATPDESTYVGRLITGINDSLPWIDDPTQQQLSDFFEKDVYPAFRYIMDTQPPYSSMDQIPSGDYDVIKSGGSAIKAKDL
jgi:hypothetical protein